MSLRRDRNRGSKGFKMTPSARKLSDPKCINCGESGSHFVPPSLGEAGFYICDKKPAA